MQTENKQQAVDQQYIANIRGAAKKRKAKGLLQYDEGQVFMRGGVQLPQIIGIERLARLQDIIAARKQGKTRPLCS